MIPDFSKSSDGLIPVIVQDDISSKVLMLGYMNEEAFAQTKQSNRVSFYSRSKKRMWTKGETSGNFLAVKNILLDCDNDTILIKAIPAGPVCHNGTDTCFGEDNSSFSLEKLESIILDRKLHPDESSYTAALFKGGINKVAQKLGEEAIELVIESKDDNQELFVNEAADLLFHFLVLLHAKESSLKEVTQVLTNRHSNV